MGGDHLSSFHTLWVKAQRTKEDFMDEKKSLHGVLHGGLWIRFYGLPKLLLGPPPRGEPDANSGDHDFFKYFSKRANCRENSSTYSIIDSMTNKHHQVILSN